MIRKFISFHIKILRVALFVSSVPRAGPAGSQNRKRGLRSPLIIGARQPPSIKQEPLGDYVDILGLQYPTKQYEVTKNKK